MNPDWRKTLISPEATLKQAIQNLDQTAMQIALVVSENGVLLGTITDGDIRRGLLRGLEMESRVENVISRNPFVVPPEMNRDMVMHLMRVNKIRQIPVVDEKRKVLGLHLWDEIGKKPFKPNTMVIMAGGMGTRLRPHTENCPKPLLPVAGKPILEHIILKAKSDGFENFILAIHYLGHMIEDYFGDGKRWEVNIKYLHEKLPLGTAGALSLLSPCPSFPFLVSNGDVLTDVRYGEVVDFHNRQEAFATMAVRLHEWQNPFGVVKTKGIELIGFEEKPIYRAYVNAGVYVLDPKTIDFLNSGEHCDMPELLLRLQKKNKRVIVYPLHEHWLDVGRFEDYELAKNELDRQPENGNL